MVAKQFLNPQVFIYCNGIENVKVFRVRETRRCTLLHFMLNLFSQFRNAIPELRNMVIQALAKLVGKGNQFALKAVGSMGGAKTIQQFLSKNYIDEIHIQLIPILLAGGKRLFDNLNKQVKLKPIKTLSSENAIHLSFSVNRKV